MSKQPTLPPPVRLTNHSQWHTWIALIKASAIQSNIWHLIDLLLDEEPLDAAPSLPLRNNIPGSNDSEQNNNYTDAIQRFNVEYREHRERREALVRTLSAIHSTISSDFLAYIIDKHSPWKALKTLQKAIEPHSAARNLEINNRYEALCAGPPRGQDLRQWLNKWERIYVEAKEIKYADVESGYIVDYFIQSLKGVDPTWTTISAYDLEKYRSRGMEVPSFMEFLNNYRRNHAQPIDQQLSSFATSATPTSTTSATLQGRPPAGPRSRSRSPMPTPRCICGSTHFYSDCFYLMEHKRPKYWKPNTDVKKRIDEALKDLIFKSKVERSRQRDLRFQAATTAAATTDTQSELSATPGSFATRWHKTGDTKPIRPTPSSHSAITPTNYDIANCWILDSGSNIHVCNDPNRFKPTHTTTEEDYLVSGTTTYPIEAYGTVDITITTPTGNKRNLTLLQVALVTGFFTNLVSFSKATEKAIYWDTKKATLYTTLTDGKQNDFCSLQPHNGHWIVEYNSPNQASSAAAQNNLLPQTKELEICTLAYTNPTLPTNTEQSHSTPTTVQPDKAASEQPNGRQPYPTPPLSDERNAQSSSSAQPPACANNDENNTQSPSSAQSPESADNEENSAEGNGERPWEYRQVGAPAPRSSEISAHINENLILDGRTRNRRQAHAAMINHLDQHSGYHAAFATNITKDHLHSDRLPEEPENWKQMLKHQHASQFTQAAHREFEHLQSRGTFELASKTAARSQILPLVWVFKYKFDDNGYLVKHKARLCVRGGLQKTEQDTAAATLAIRVFRALMAITASFKLIAKQYDAVNAFINSPINEEIYVDYPEGMNPPATTAQPCLLLLRALYGLKQSPLLWLQEVTSTLLQLGLDPVPGVDCLFTDGYLILFFHVDDFVLLHRPGDEARFKKFESGLLAAYEIRSLGDLRWFLGIRIIRREEKLYLCQDSYIEKLAEKYKTIATSLHPKTPLSTEPLTDYDGVATAAQIHGYQQRIGSLTFAATTTRPDIACATAKLARYLTNPSPLHQAAANRLLSYLYHSRYLAIQYAESSNNPIFLSSSDAAFADDEKTRKSPFGYLIQFYGGPIDWKASKQTTVTTSSTEAELLALSETARQTLWWTRFFTNIQLDMKQPMVIYCDNKQTLNLVRADTPRLMTRLKHVDIHSCWLRQEVQQKNITTGWIPAANMPADGLTKPLTIQKHQNFIKLLNMTEVKQLIASSSAA